MLKRTEKREHASKLTLNHYRTQQNQFHGKIGAELFQCLAEQMRTCIWKRLTCTRRHSRDQELKFGHTFGDLQFKVCSFEVAFSELVRIPFGGAKNLRPPLPWRICEGPQNLRMCWRSTDSFHQGATNFLTPETPQNYAQGTYLWGQLCPCLFNSSAGVSAPGL